MYRELGGERARYFQELLQRIRDIRSNARNFYQKVTDIYATVQNKMHYVVHSKTDSLTADDKAKIKINIRAPAANRTPYGVLRRRAFHVNWRMAANTAAQTTRQFPLNPWRGFVLSGLSSEQ